MIILNQFYISNVHITISFSILRVLKNDQNEILNIYMEKKKLKN